MLASAGSPPTSPTARPVAVRPRADIPSGGDMTFARARVRPASRRVRSRRALAGGVPGAGPAGEGLVAGEGRAPCRTGCATPSSTRSSRERSPRRATCRASPTRLDHVRDLGATVVWLMPIQPIGAVKRKGTFGSPYSIRDYAAVNPDYGTAEDVKTLVREAHARGPAGDPRRRGEPHVVGQRAHEDARALRPRRAGTRAAAERRLVGRREARLREPEDAGLHGRDDGGLAPRLRRSTASGATWPASCPRTSGRRRAQRSSACGPTSSCSPSGARPT